MRHFMPATIVVAAIIGAAASDANQPAAQPVTASPVVQLAAMSSCDTSTSWHATAQALAIKLADATDPEAVRVRIILSRAGYPCIDTSSSEASTDSGTITGAETTGDAGTARGAGTAGADSGSSLGEANSELANIESKYGDLFSWGARASSPIGTDG